MTDGRPCWKNRRRFMIVVSVFFAAVVAYVLGAALDTKPAETAVMFAMVGLTGIVGSYVFAATWDDKK